MDEGYVKFKFEFLGTQTPSQDELQDLIDLRAFLFDLGLIGYSEGISFGNISKRVEGRKFIISASNTGKFRFISPEYFVYIATVDLERNLVRCVGKNPPSSETITHYAVYETFPRANFVVHFHNLKIWSDLKNRVITTPENAGFGTVELAMSILELKNKFPTNTKKGIIVLGGHKSGIIAFGENPDRLKVEIQNLFQKK